MGYSTSYKGSAEITPKLTPKTINTLAQAILNCHERGGWSIEISDNFKSIVWTGQEKTYDFEVILTELEKYMRLTGNDFTLVGEFRYKGEDRNDVGYIQKVDGKWQRIKKI